MRRCVHAALSGAVRKHSMSSSLLLSGEKSAGRFMHNATTTERSSLRECTMDAHCIPFVCDLPASGFEGSLGSEMTQLWHEIDSVDWESLESAERPPATVVQMPQLLQTAYAPFDQGRVVRDLILVGIYPSAGV